MLGIREKELGSVQPINQIPEFRNAVSDYPLHDLGFSGTPYTWITTRSGGFKEQLDMMFVTYRLKDFFRNAKVTHLDPSKYDHVPVLLKVDEPQSRGMFRFKSFWTNHKESEGIIRDAWN